jgi:hypothetical protein
MESRLKIQLGKNVVLERKKRWLDSRFFIGMATHKEEFPPP